jgi:hypothetical protein
VQAADAALRGQLANYIQNNAQPPAGQTPLDAAGSAGEAAARTAFLGDVRQALQNVPNYNAAAVVAGVTATRQALNGGQDTTTALGLGLTAAAAAAAPPPAPAAAPPPAPANPPANAAPPAGGAFTFRPGQHPGLAYMAALRAAAAANTAPPPPLTPRAIMSIDPGVSAADATRFAGQMRANYGRAQGAYQAQLGAATGTAPAAAPAAAPPNAAPAAPPAAAPPQAPPAAQTNQTQMAARLQSDAGRVTAAQSAGLMPKWYPASTPVTYFDLPRYTDQPSGGVPNMTDRISAFAASQRNTLYNQTNGTEDQAIKDYQDGVGWGNGAMGVYQPINRVLRGLPEVTSHWNSSPTVIRRVNDTMQALDSAMDKAVTPENIIAFRGIRGPHAFNGTVDMTHWNAAVSNFNKLQVGDVGRDNAFASATLSRKVADRDFTNGIPGNDAYIMEYRVPKGTRAISMNAMNPNSNSYAKTVELLLDRGTQYQVVAKFTETRGGINYHHMVVDVLDNAQQAAKPPLPKFK